MKHQAQNTIKALMMVAILFVSVEAFSDEDCDKYNAFINRDNLMDLTQAIDAAQDELYAKMDATNTNAKFDLRRKIDRQTLKQNDPMYALNAVGKVTSASSKDIKAEENRSWGTGFMISPCHMITNHHVVCEKDDLSGKRVCRQDGSVKKQANFSFGENESGTDFEKRVTGDVVEADAITDYAIVRMDSLKNDEVPFIVPNFWDVSDVNNSTSLGVGYPAQSTRENSHKIYGMKSKLSVNGKRLSGKITFTPGNSGSPTLSLKQNKLWASGLVVGGGLDSKGNAKVNSKAEIMSMPVIGNSLKEKNPTLLKEILNAIKTGRCE